MKLNARTVGIAIVVLGVIVLAGVVWASSHARQPAAASIVKPSGVRAAPVNKGLTLVAEARDDDDRHGPRRQEREEEEVVIDFEQLPAPVQETVKKAYPGANVTKCTKETEEGKVEYTVELKKGDREVELELDASGKTLETKQEIPPTELPRAIQHAVKKLMPGAKLLEAERTTKGERTSYEVEVQCAGVALELTLDRAGNVSRIKVEKKSDEEEGQENADD